MKLSNYIVDINCSVVNAMEQIDKNAKGIVYVTQSGKLVGTVTDGDIRRYVMRQGDISRCVTAIMNTAPMYLEQGCERKAHAYMIEKSIRSVPVINKESYIVKIVFEDCVVEEKEVLNIPVVIMAGGKGTRLQPYTQILPKPLIPIGEKTITEHIMDRFIEYGCSDFIMIVNYKKNFIKSYFQDNNSCYKVNFLEEKEFLGTGGGLKLLQNVLDRTFFMTNCDILVEANYKDILEFHQKNENIITLVCAEKNMVIPYGTVEVSASGQALALKEKPSLSFITNTGFYVIEPEFLNMIPENTFIHITDVIQNCIDTGKNVGVYKISEEKWLDMGQMEEMERMRQKLDIK